MKKQLLERIESLETMISIYSDRDQIRTSELANDLHKANMQLLDIMTSEVA